MFWSTLFHIMFKELMLSNCGAGEDSWKSLGKHGDQTSQSERKWTLNTLRKDWCWDWCWNWSSSTLATWCKQLTHWKRPWCWERLKAEEEGYKGWAGWMASLVHELRQTLGDGEGHEGLACCSPWGCEELDTTWWLNNNKEYRKSGTSEPICRGWIEL